MKSVKCTKVLEYFLIFSGFIQLIYPNLLAFILTLIPMLLFIGVAVCAACLIAPTLQREKLTFKEFAEYFNKKEIVIPNLFSTYASVIFFGLVVLAGGYNGILHFTTLVYVLIEIVLLVIVYGIKKHK
jgi:hypothetical protein